MGLVWWIGLLLGSSNVRQFRPFFDRPDNTYALLLMYIFDPEHLVVPEILLLVEEICSRGTQIYDFRTTVPILFKASAFEAVKSVWYALRKRQLALILNDPSGILLHLATTNNTLILIIAKRAFVANANKRCGADVAIAHRALPITFVAETSDSYTWLFPAHD